MIVHTDVGNITTNRKKKKKHKTTILNDSAMPTSISKEAKFYFPETLNSRIMQ
jgi:hypothetical protein